jgi:hypothetical protein
MHVGIDNDDYPPGYLTEAKPEWISKSLSCLFTSLSDRRDFQLKREIFLPENMLNSRGRPENNENSKKKSNGTIDRRKM